MPTTLMCPHCRAAVAVPDELLGGNATCPYCRNVFAAPMPLPDEPPPAPPAAAFSFGPPAAGGDDRPAPRRPAAGSQQVELTAGSWIVLAVVTAICVGLGLGMQSFPKWVVNGIDVTRALCMGGIGAAAAGGIALARALGKPKGGANYRARR